MRGVLRGGNLRPCPFPPFVRSVFLRYFPLRPSHFPSPLTHSTCNVESFYYDHDIQHVVTRIVSEQKSQHR